MLASGRPTSHSALPESHGRVHSPSSPLSALPHAHATLRALLAICLFTYVAQNMLNTSIAPLARALGLREWVVGLAVSTAALAVTLLSQFWGRRSISWGRRRVLLISLCLALSAGCLFSATIGLRVFGHLGATAAGIGIVAARGPFFGSATAAIPPTGQALIAELTTDEASRVRGMAAFSGSVQLSIVIGSLLSSALGAWSIYAPVHATPLFILVALGIAAVAIPEGRRSAAHRPRGTTHRSVMRTTNAAAGTAHPEQQTTSIRKTEDRARTAARGAEDFERHSRGAPLPPRVSWSDARLLPWIGAAFGMFFTAGVVQIIAGFIVQDRLHLAPERAISLTAVMLLANATGAMLTQLLIVPRLGWRPGRLVRTGVTMAAVALAVLALAPTLWLMAAATFTIGMSSGLVGPGFTAGGSLAVSPAEQGGAAGILNATGATTWIFAPVTATALYGWHPLAPFILALCVLSASIIAAWAAPALGHSGAGPEQDRRRDPLK